MGKRRRAACAAGVEPGLQRRVAETATTPDLRPPANGDPAHNQEPPDNGEPGPVEPGSGVLEMHPNGYGFLRDPKNNYFRELTDPFVPGSMIEKYGLREGVMITGMVQPGRRQQGPRLERVLDVDGMPPEKYRDVKAFDVLTPINPEFWLRLETGPEPLTTRVMDLLTPLGKGQRALIVAPPRTGKTILLQHISHGISTNYPGVKLIVLLIDERPEEVTDMRGRSTAKWWPAAWTATSRATCGSRNWSWNAASGWPRWARTWCCCMDSITRLARAFNKWVGNTGRTMSGGVDIKAMDIPKKLFATARLFEEGGSLTIVGTALIDTGSRMDELIFQEFKGTGNMELVLGPQAGRPPRVAGHRHLAIRHAPRGEAAAAGMLHAVTMLRRTLSTMHPVDAMEQLTSKLAKFSSNQDFIDLIAGSRSVDPEFAGAAGEQSPRSRHGQQNERSRARESRTPPRGSRRGHWSRSANRYEGGAPADSKGLQTATL